MIFVSTLLTIQVNSYDNGLALTPPMGWLSWSQFACEVDCENRPKSCINANLYEEMADALVKEGFLAAGYNYVNIDDCWSEVERDRSSRVMIPDQKRFPNGIKGVADYVHSKGLKFGLYSDIGTKTCAGYPGHLNENGENPSNYFDIDAETFAGWEVDSLKVDGCNIDPSPCTMDLRYKELSLAFNKTGRPILLFCSGPFYEGRFGRLSADKINFSLYREHCNGWRYMDDIWYNWYNRTAWESILDIIDFYKENVDIYERYHGPGGWFDPDALIIGSGLLNKNQEEAHMAIWAIMAAPLLMSNDVRNISKESKDILLNLQVIGVNQDPGAIAGKPVKEGDWVPGQEVWTKKLAADENESYAVVYFNRGESPVTMSHQLSKIIPSADTGFSAYDLFQYEDLGTFAPTDEVSLTVPATGVRMFKLRKS